MRRSFQCVLTCVALSSVAACAYNPYDGQALGSSRQADFRGFATEANALIHVQAQWPFNGGWYEIATTNADSTPWSGDPPFTTDLYQWYVYPIVPTWAFDGAGQAHLRTEQRVGSNWVAMFMYDEDGWNCLVSGFLEELLDADDEPLNAAGLGVECSDDGAGNTRHEIMVRL